MTDSSPASSSTTNNGKEEEEKVITNIICCGLNCLDLQLIGCTKSSHQQSEAIEQYDKAEYCAGGSACMTATTLGLLTTSKTSKTKIKLLTKLGNDRNGEIILDFMNKYNVDITSLVIQDPNVSTAMSILPIFKTGGRGCYFNLGSNNSFTKDDIISRLLSEDNNNQKVDAFLFGYPHLLPKLQGENLKSMMEYVKKKQQKYGGSNNTLIGIDLNGVNADNHNDDLLLPSLQYVDVLHLNEEEAEIISGFKSKDLNIIESKDKLKEVTNRLHDGAAGGKGGCAVVLLSLGPKGTFISVTSDTTRLDSTNSLTHKQISSYWEPGSSVHIPAFAIEEGQINTNGAGDALFSGFCYIVATSMSSMSNNVLSLQQAGQFASLVAHQRCNIKTREVFSHDVHGLLDMVLNNNLPPTIQ